MPLAATPATHLESTGVGTNGSGFGRLRPKAFRTRGFIQRPVSTATRFEKSCGDGQAGGRVVTPLFGQKLAANGGDERGVRASDPVGARQHDKARYGSGSGEGGDAVEAWLDRARAPRCRPRGGSRPGPGAIEHRCRQVARADFFRHLQRLPPQPARAQADQPRVSPRALYHRRARGGGNGGLCGGGRQRPAGGAAAATTAMGAGKRPAAAASRTQPAGVRPSRRKPSASAAVLKPRRPLGQRRDDETAGGPCYGSLAAHRSNRPRQSAASRPVRGIARSDNRRPRAEDSGFARRLAAHSVARPLSSVRGLVSQPFSGSASGSGACSRARRASTTSGSKKASAAASTSGSPRPPRARP